MDILRLDGSGFAALPDFDITLSLLRKDVSQACTVCPFYITNIIYVHVFFDKLNE